MEISRRLAGEAAGCRIEGEPGGQGVAAGQRGGESERIAVYIGEATGRQDQVDGLVLCVLMIGDTRQHHGRIVDGRDGEKEAVGDARTAIACLYRDLDGPMIVGRRRSGHTSACEDQP